MIITAYRITRKEFAASIWSGYGAREFGGRWNSKGVAVIYTAESRALAAMEQLVHLVKPRILKGYVVASISFHEEQVTRLSTKVLPPGWKNPVAPAALKKFGDRWIRGAKHLVLAVPSVVIPGEWNFLINPLHPEFAATRKSAPMRFGYDPRFA